MHIVCVNVSGENHSDSFKAPPIGTAPGPHDAVKTLSTFQTLPA